MNEPWQRGQRATTGLACGQRFGYPHPGTNGSALPGSDWHGHVSASIADDGRGGADPKLGSGLRDLADRAAADDGRLEIVSTPGRGASIRTTLPMAPALYG